MSQEKIAILEALVFASDTPLASERAAEVLTDTDKKEVLALFDELGRAYEAREGGIQLVQVAGGFQFRTKPEMAPWIRKLKAARPAMLSTAAIETLAVIAYRQPLVKADIDRVRGVDASGALKGLLEKKLVRIVGRKDVPGKPIIYGTTKKFLEIFNLKDLTELPTLRDLKDLQDDGALMINLELPNILGEQEPQEERGPAACHEPAMRPDVTEPQEDDGRDLAHRSAAAVPADSPEMQGDDTATEPSEVTASRSGQEPQGDGGPSLSDRSESPDTEDSPESDSPADHAAPPADTGLGLTDHRASPALTDSEVPQGSGNERQE
ncbi:MAG: SMC-Scp complex subunit ScpB [Syntrophales bacterium]